MAFRANYAERAALKVEAARRGITITEVIRSALRDAGVWVRPAGDGSTPASS